MVHHPALRWVSNAHQIGEPGNEAHVLDEMGAGGFNEMLGQGTAGKYGRTAPVANETDRVIDCELLRTCSAVPQQAQQKSRGDKLAAVGDVGWSS